MRAYFLLLLALFVDRAVTKPTKKCDAKVAYVNPNVTKINGLVASVKRIHFPESEKVSNAAIAWRNQSSNSILVAYSMIDTVNNGLIRFYEGTLHEKSMKAAPLSSSKPSPYNVSLPKRYSFPHRLYKARELKWGENSSHAILRYTNGEDPRILYISEFEIYIVWNDLAYNNRRIHLGTISLRPFGVNLPVVNVSIINDPRYIRGVQKNWSPFMLESSLHLEKSINPHCVINNTLCNSTHPECHIKFVESISCTYSEFVSKHWEFGTPRGGSPSYRFNDSHYLGSFHSSRTESNSNEKPN